MNCDKINISRNINLEYRRSNIVFLYIVACNLMLFLFFSTGSCKQKNNNDIDKDVVKWEDIKDIGYPDIEVQEKRLNSLINNLEPNEPIEKRDEILRKMIEIVPFSYIETYLNEEPNKIGKHNMTILNINKKIQEIRNIQGDTLDRFIKENEKNNNLLCVSLFGLRSESDQLKASEVLGLLADTKAVRSLTMRLLYASATSTGGYEVQVPRKKLRLSLVKSLEKCTKLDFSNYDPSSDESTYAVIKSCMDWLEKNQK